MNSNNADKVVVITGASSGLREAAARLLAQQGAKLIVGARRLDRLQALASELKPDDSAVVETDVTDRTQVQRLVDRAVELHGRVDVMLNNAGLMPSAMLSRLHVGKWDPHDRRQHQGRPVWRSGGAAGDAGAKDRPLH